MANFDMLRVSLFGGYRKEDVQDYIQVLEREMEGLKEMHQQEKTSLEEEQKSREELHAEELERIRQEMEKGAKARDELSKELAKVREELRQAREECRGAGAVLREKEQALAEQKRALLEQEKLLRSQKEQIGQLQAELEQKQNQPGEDQGFLDSETIRQVLDDASENARMILEDAAEERDRILKEANREAELQKQNIAARIHSDLEEKGIQLMAARHKMDKYVREVKSAQEGLYMVYSRMSRMLDNMPARIDDYWDGRAERLLPENSPEETEPEKAAALEDSEGEA